MILIEAVSHFLVRQPRSITFKDISRSFFPASDRVGIGCCSGFGLVRAVFVVDAASQIVGEVLLVRVVVGAAFGFESRFASVRFSPFAKRLLHIAFL